MRGTRWILAISVAMSLISPAYSGELAATNGWQAWQVRAVENAPDLCCYEWHGEQPERQVCELDRRVRGFSTHEVRTSQPGELTLYAWVEDEQIRYLRALSSDCPVRSDQEILRLGCMDNTKSVALLEPLLRRDHKMMDHALAAIAFHAGNEAFQVLRQRTQAGDTLEQRKQAVFWLAQSRVTKARDDLMSLMRSGSERELRKHAVFSYSQSIAPDRDAVLIDLIEDQSLAHEERKNALFWLAHSDSREAFDYLQAVLLR
ncbi:MAG: hypothetical protein AAGJ86_04900 [Pseudomonadota bacterium]